MNGLITDIYMHVFFVKKKFVGIRKGANTNQTGNFWGRCKSEPFT